MRIDRRTFSGLSRLPSPARPAGKLSQVQAQSRKLNIASAIRDHVAVGNPSTPGPMRLADPAAIEQIVKDIAGLGFYGIELFGWQIGRMEAHWPWPH